MINYESKIFDHRTIRAIDMGNFRVAHEEFSLAEWASDLYDIFLQRSREDNFRFKSEFGEIYDNSVVGDSESLKKVMLGLFELTSVIIPLNRNVVFRVEQMSDYAADYTFLRIVLRAEGDEVRKDALDTVVMSSPITAGEDASHLLTLTKKLLGLMNGSLTVQVREKQAVIFTVAIPLYRRSYSSEEPGKGGRLDSLEAYNLDKLRVLVGLGNSLERAIMLAVLERFGTKVDTASNGGEVIGKFMALPPGTYKCVLTDLRFADMDGFEVARRLRGSGHSQAETIPIVGLAESSYAEAVAQAFECGMNDCLKKPLDYKMLLKYFICLKNEK